MPESSGVPTDAEVDATATATIEPAVREWTGHPRYTPLLVRGFLCTLACPFSFLTFGELATLMGGKSRGEPEGWFRLVCLFPTLPFY
jgi:hypothetical protein